MTTAATQRPARQTVRAPRGPERTCKGWVQEAALRMLMNNLDPEVAEDPDHLVVYGGSGKAARTWRDFDTIVSTLRQLGNDETLLVQSRKPVGVIRTHDLAPPVRRPRRGPRTAGAGQGPTRAAQRRPARQLRGGAARVGAPRRHPRRTDRPDLRPRHAQRLCACRPRVGGGPRRAAPPRSGAVS